jgi:hypothetical protein
MSCKGMGMKGVVSFRLLWYISVRGLKEIHKQISTKGLQLMYQPGYETVIHNIKPGTLSLEVTNVACLRWQFDSNCFVVM